MNAAAQPAFAAPPRPDRPEKKEQVEIRLASNQEERDHYDQLAELYSIIITTEALEKAYIRGVDSDEYTRACNDLITRFKAQRDGIHDIVPSVEKFMGDYKMRAKNAANRLLVKGVPATIEHGGASNDKGDNLTILMATQSFITTMDTLKLNMSAADELHPHLSELMDSLNKVGLPPDHEAKVKVKDWLMQLNQMRAHEELTEDQVRQMYFDMDNAYNAFHRHIRDRSH